MIWWRWVFSSSLLPSWSLNNWTNGAVRAIQKASCGLLNLTFPDDCHVCGELLKNFSRVPVCPGCLAEPEPLAAEFFCVTCRTPFVNRFPLDEEGRCGLCRMGLQGFDAVYSYGSYEDTLRKLVHVYKYAGVRPLARPLAGLMIRAIPRETRFDAVVPMPLHWFKHWQRGFNQAELLAGEVARKWNVPLVRAVRRRKSTTPQAGLSNAKRRANMRGAFEATRRLDGMRVLLVDDVLTTGATASACARALKRAGAASVALAALARADRRLNTGTEDSHSRAEGARV